MKRLTMDVLRNINQDYNYNYNLETLQSIYNELTLTESVNLNDIFDEFESIGDFN